MRSVNRLGPVAWLANKPAGTGILLAGLGFFIWIGLSFLAGLTTDEPAFRLREAWDSSAYFYIGLPLMTVAVAIAGFVRPKQVWRWPAALVAGHQVGVLILGLGMQSGLSLILLTLILAILLAVLFTIPAFLGALASRHLAERAY